MIAYAILLLMQLTYWLTRKNDAERTGLDPMTWGRLAYFLSLIRIFNRVLFLRPSKSTGKLMLNHLHSSLTNLRDEEKIQQSHTYLSGGGR